MNKKNKTIMLLGVVHSAQATNLLKLHIKILKERKFSADFIEKDKERILSLRETMLNHIRLFKPEMVAEESGPWLINPGDRLKDIIGNKKTILERSYKKRHFFVDAKMDKFGRKPSQEIREKEIANQILKKFKGNQDLKKVVAVVGASHFQNIKGILKRHDFKLRAINLKKKFNSPR